MLEKAIDFCNGIGFPVDEYEIIVVESLGEGVLGQALTDNGQQKILLAHNAFSMGTKIVAGTLIEEHTHLRHGYADCSRGLQDFFLNALVGLGEQINGEPL